MQTGHVATAPGCPGQGQALTDPGGGLLSPDVSISSALQFLPAGSSSALSRQHPRNTPILPVNLTTPSTRFSSSKKVANRIKQDCPIIHINP